ncbi:hypothetical protein [Listeria newyorkensis]|uniref:hypothetical protein n=1 Tax=Listeria newyorkensis TaxID=1497681 RepID=UPI00051D0ADA|nr:hypothetical protein [Listeria newyorkensis]KGL43613.1 hypothetical protein EP58_07700 [Listeria newyorkensis]
MIPKMKYKRTKYQIAAGIVAFLCVLLLSSWFILPSENGEKHSKVGASIALDNREVTLIDSVYFEDKRRLEMDFYVGINDVTQIKNIKATVIKTGDVSTKYQTKFIKINESFYVLFVQDLPKNWKSVRITLAQEGEEDTFMATANPFYAAQKKVAHEATFKPKSEAYYESKQIDLFIQDSEKTIAKNEKEIKKLRASNEKIKRVNEDLRANISYQPKDKQEEMTTNVQGNESTIVMQIEKTKELETRNQELQEAIQKAKNKQKMLDWL